MCAPVGQAVRSLRAAACTPRESWERRAPVRLRSRLRSALAWQAGQAVTRPTKNAMRLTFLGTRGEIDARTRRHRMHTSLLVSYRGANVMIDAGLDWLGKLKRVGPERDCAHTRASRSRLGIKTGRALSGVCDAKNVAGITALSRSRIAT